jgi:hypothetical protein
MFADKARRAYLSDTFSKLAHYGRKKFYSIVSRPPPKRMLPQSSVLPISQPVKSAKYNVSVTHNVEEPASTAPQFHAKHDLVVWFEVLELGKLMNG